MTYSRCTSEHTMTGCLQAGRCVCPREDSAATPERQAILDGLKKARHGVDMLRDHTRTLGVMNFRERDEHVTAIHNMLDQLAWLAGRETPAPTPSRWQPIETAPKDGTWIVVTRGEIAHVVLWFFDDWAREDMWVVPPPTHWMPLEPYPAVAALTPRDKHEHHD